MFRVAVIPGSLEMLPVGEAVEFVRHYAWLAEFRILDFISNAPWNGKPSSLLHAFPADWRAYAESLPCEGYASHLIDLATNGQVMGEQAEGLQDFLTKCRKLCCCLAADSPPENALRRARTLQKRKNIKLKKTYEIEEISHRLSELLEKYGLDHAVDIGAGQGYLTVELAKCIPSLRSIVAVECSDSQLHGMSSRLQTVDARERKIVQLKRARLDAGKPADDFDRLIFASGAEGGGDEYKASPTGIPPYLMYSLHACGSLSETMIQFFCDTSSHARVLFNIGCCYNLIDEGLPGKHFPMSQEMARLWRERKDGEPQILTRNMKMVACQAPYRWGERPEQTKKFFKRHFYRSLLERLLRDQGLLAPGEESRIANIGDAALSSFKDYVTAAWKTPLPGPSPDSRIIDKYVNQFGHLEKCLAFIWTVRALLGPLIEALILHDRLLYVREMVPNVQAVLVSVFDPLVSPRNVALVAIKEKE